MKKDPTTNNKLDITFGTPLPTDLSSLRSLWQEAFGDSDKFLDSFFNTAYDAKRCRVATIDGNVVAALYWFNGEIYNKPIAYIYAVATATNYRRLGICSKLMENTHIHMKTLGYSGVILSPADDNLTKFYEKLGYNVCSHIHEFSCDANLSKAYPPVDIRNIAKQEYGILRRQFLPPNGVIQENENLDFLETQCSFYAGSDFLLAAYKDVDTLHGIELLGNTNFALSITSALQCEKGIFRCPKGDKVFAMFYSLSDSIFSKSDNYSLETDTTNIYIGFIFD